MSAFLREPRFWYAVALILGFWWLAWRCSNTRRRWIERREMRAFLEKHERQTEAQLRIDATSAAEQIWDRRARPAESEER